MNLIRQEERNEVYRPDNKNDILVLIDKESGQYGGQISVWDNEPNQDYLKIGSTQLFVIYFSDNKPEDFQTRQQAIELVTKLVEVL